jgi:hypothetical protein
MPGSVDEPRGSARVTAFLILVPMVWCCPGAPVFCCCNGSKGSQCQQGQSCGERVQQMHLQMSDTWLCVAGVTKFSRVHVVVRICDAACSSVRHGLTLLPTSQQLIWTPHYANQEHDLPAAESKGWNSLCNTLNSIFSPAPGRSRCCCRPCRPCRRRCSGRPSCPPVPSDEPSDTAV